MSDTQTAPQPTPASDSRVLAIVCYALFILVFSNGITHIVGVVLAYIKRGEARGTIWESHFNNIIRIFWTSVVFFMLFVAVAAVGVFGVWHTAMTDQFSAPILVLPVLWLAGIGYLIWYLYRTVRGLLLAIESKPYV